MGQTLMVLLLFAVNDLFDLRKQRRGHDRLLYCLFVTVTAICVVLYFRRSHGHSAAYYLLSWLHMKR